MSFSYNGIEGLCGGTGGYSCKPKNYETPIIPKYEEAMHLYKTAYTIAKSSTLFSKDNLMDISDCKRCDGPVKYTAEALGIDRRSVRRLKNEDPIIYHHLTQMDITANQNKIMESSEFLSKSPEYQKIRSVYSKFTDYLKNPAIDLLAKVKLADMPIYKTPEWKSIDSLVSDGKIDANDSEKMRNQLSYQFVNYAKSEMFCNALKDIPDSYLIAKSAILGIDGKTDLKSAARQYESSYFHMVAEAAYTQSNRYGQAVNFTEFRDNFMELTGLNDYIPSRKVKDATGMTLKELFMQTKSNSDTSCAPKIDDTLFAEKKVKDSDEEVMQIINRLKIAAEKHFEVISEIESVNQKAA